MRIQSLWRVAQWSSRFPLETSHVVRTAECLVLSNAARQLTICPSRRTIYMRLDGSTEFGARLRNQGEPWPHLLLESGFRVQPRLADLEELRLDLEARLERLQAPTGVVLQRRLHAAQCLLYIVVQNRTRGHPNYGDYLWFGVPMFDSRHRFHPGYAAEDTGTRKFIVSVPITNFTRQSLHEGGWCRIGGDLLPFMYDAIHTARSHGYLLGDLPPSDHQVVGMNLGWEITGPLDAALTIRDFSLTARPKSSQSSPEVTLSNLAELLAQFRGGRTHTNSTLEMPSQTRMVHSDGRNWQNCTWAPAQRGTEPRGLGVSARALRFSRAGLCHTTPTQLRGPALCLLPSR